MSDVGCAGVIVADTFCGPMARLPHAGELFAIDSMPAKVGGCAANVAIDLVKQGASVDLFGCVGRDTSAQMLLGGLRDANVGCDHVIYNDRFPTSKTVILLVEGEDRRYIHVFGANAAFRVNDIQRDWLDGLKVFYLGGLFAMPGIDTRELADLLSYCQARSIVTVVDVVVPQTAAGNYGLKDLLPHVDYFLPNEDEAERLTGVSGVEHQIETFQKLGARGVVITRGTAGAVAARDGQIWRSEAFKMAAVDPSGSGDAFTAGMITGILHGWDMPKTLCYGAALGGSATLAIGTTDSVFTADQAQKFLEARSDRT